MASISSLTNRVLASEVASAVTNGTSRSCDSVSHISVLPVPEDPMSSTLLFTTACVVAARARPILR